MVRFRVDHIAAGGNRHPAAAQWDEVAGFLAFGSGVLSDRQIVASGGADATIKIWQLNYAAQRLETLLLQTIETRPKFIPLTIALSTLESGTTILTTGGTKADVYVYATKSEHSLERQMTLKGHEGWVRSLAISKETDESGSDLLLASASQDKYIRIWRIHKNPTPTTTGRDQSSDVVDFEDLLSNKTHHLVTPSDTYSMTFEALLIGHDDWIYTVAWQRNAGTLRLLSASADNSLAIWASDVASGVWVCTTRLGEISAQKGSTTATGSMGGFWIGLWSPDGQSVASLGTTGSWRLWTHDKDRKRWNYGVGISGHTKSVMDIAWARDGSYLLSTGSDQTTRLHAEWAKGGYSTWHEFARPQIHGYDLNCIDVVGPSTLVSGADEKLLRIFDEPKATAELLQRLCGIENIRKQSLPVAASIPVLGLSNKAVVEGSEDEAQGHGASFEHLPSHPTGLGDVKRREADQPPIEDDLARHTLWPEREKLYGHGYEISAVAASHDGSIIATACRASSLEHAVIRLFETKEWRELKPSLVAHTLTVTSLSFSIDSQHLLSTGRDRQWAVFEKDETSPARFRVKAKNSKAHTRMVLSGCWAPIVAGRLFVTGSRDKTSKVWDLAKGTSHTVLTISASAPVTAVDMVPNLIRGMLLLAVATETGNLSVHVIEPSSLNTMEAYTLEDISSPIQSITGLSWRPKSLDQDLWQEGEDHGEYFGQLALSSKDCSLRILSVGLGNRMHGNGAWNDA
ncbi:MAG: hypothetical protein Q9174_000680 [Haloplaca sp. 1 TL-2023]